jgi:hypothetical protein
LQFRECGPQPRALLARGRQSLVDLLEPGARFLDEFRGFPWPSWHPRVVR